MIDRGALTHCIDLKLAESVRFKGTVLLLVGLEPEVLLNDSLRRGAGNQIIETVEARLEQLFDSEDIVARTGQDEFAVLIEHVGDDVAAERIASRVVHLLNRPLGEEPGALAPRVSVGVARLTGAQDCASDVLRDAKAALHLAQLNPLVDYRVFEELDRRRLVAQSTLQHDVVSALDRGEFVLYYQPIVRLDTGHPTAVEALLRWNHPTRGLVGPGAVIAAAEGTELVIRIGHWALRDACEQAAQWWSQDRTGRAPVVHVNISPHHLMYGEIVNTVARTLRDTGAPPESLCLEITETLTVEDDAAPILRHLSELGVSLSIDDFGTGHSSLSRLYNLPVDSVKLDRSFVTDVADSAASEAIAGALVAIADALDLSLIAEGIETSEQFDRLRNLGYELGQGFSFARPQPHTELDTTWPGWQLASGHTD